MRTALALLAVVWLAVAAACGGGGAPGLPPTPRLTQALPSPFPTRTPVIVPTPQEVTPVPAAQAGRPDCPTDWAAYNDPESRVSLCYPAALRAIAERASDVTSWSIGVRAPEDHAVLPEDQVFFFAYWQPKSYVGVPGPGFCAMHSQVGEVSREEGTLTVLGVDAPACFSQVNTVAPGAGVTDVVDYFQIVTQVPWPSGGFLTIRMAYRGPDLEASRGTVMRILATLAAEE